METATTFGPIPAYMRVDSVRTRFTVLTVTIWEKLETID